MDCHDNRVKLAVFEGETTYKNDYKLYCKPTDFFYGWNKVPYDKPEKPSPPFKLRDSETLAVFKDDVHIPFDLLHRLKRITRTSPYTIYKEVELPPDDKKEEAIKTRPRVYITPAVSLDDVPDPEMRRLLCQRMYTTDARNAEREVVGPPKKTAPIDRTVDIADNLKYKVELQLPVEGKWSKVSKEWDDQQNRALVDPTLSFWIHKDPPVVCGACVDRMKNIVPQETKDKISHLIKEDKLRLAHDTMCSGYAGYTPKLPLGVPLSKVELPVVHPFKSTAQANTSRYEQEKYQ